LNARIDGLFELDTTAAELIKPGTRAREVNGQVRETAPSRFYRTRHSKGGKAEPGVGTADTIETAQMEQTR
jgi:hypothetical protein